MTLYSHPSKPLIEHVSQVLEAMQIIWQHHSPKIRTDNPDIEVLGELVARVHDAGKASREFQRYIADPQNYRGNPRAKSHTAPSTYIAWATMRGEGWDALKMLATALTVAGHHSGLRFRDQLEKQFFDQATAVYLPQQLASMSKQDLYASTGKDLVLPEASDDDIFELTDYVEQEIFPHIEKLELAQALHFRLQVQLLLSLLLEADKVYLAISEIYLASYKQEIENTWNLNLIDRYLCAVSENELNNLRARIRKEIVAEVPIDESIQSLTLPTGMGKTLCAASWALAHFHALPHQQRPRKIVIVLPFLSIIDQTVSVYRDLFSDHLPGCALIASHSLADRVYDPEMESQDPEANDFFIDTWHAPLVITTFDQFLLTLMDEKARYQMRFHNLCDALVIIDEVQALPCGLWHPMDQICRELSQIGNTKFLAMSATQPGFFTSAHELIADPQEIFTRFQRYRLILQCHTPISLHQFIEKIKARCPLWQNRRVLITLNTRKSARAVLDALPAEGSTIYFITSDVTPKERLQAIAAIRKGDPCIVVSTQCIEAGVDIDMDLVVRDFAPLDSLVQIAGRCNRNNTRPRCDVEIFHLQNDNGRSFCKMIYDKILIAETIRVLEHREIIPEEEIYLTCAKYFQQLMVRKNLGEKVTRDLAYMERHEDIHTLLRGKNRKKYEFIVIEQDPDLEDSLKKALEIDDRWQRRRALRSLAGRVNQVTIAVFAHPDFDPERIATPLWHLWLLKPKFYQPGRGLHIPEEGQTCTQLF